MPSPFFRSVSTAYWDTSGPREPPPPPRTESSFESPRESPSMEDSNRRWGEPEPRDPVGEEPPRAPGGSPAAWSPSVRVSASPFSTLFFFPGRMWHRAAIACRISSSTSSRTRALVAASRTEK